MLGQVAWPLISLKALLDGNCEVAWMVWVKENLYSMDKKRMVFLWHALLQKALWFFLETHIFLFWDVSGNWCHSHHLYMTLVKKKGIPCPLGERHLEIGLHFLVDKFVSYCMSNFTRENDDCWKCIRLQQIKLFLGHPNEFKSTKVGTKSDWIQFPSDFHQSLFHFIWL